MYLKFAKTRSVKSPSRANHGDAGLDFFIPDDFSDGAIENIIMIEPNTGKLIPSGIKLEVPFGWAMVMFNKSGISVKKGLTVGAQVIDHGYTGEVGLHVFNVGRNTAVLRPGDKLVQGLLIPVSPAVVLEIPEDELYSKQPILGTNRGDGGYGSTGQ